MGTAKGRAKERERESWSQVAAGWARHDDRLRSSLSPVSERMLAAVNLKPGRRVLDIASGTGQPALLAAERVGPKGRVLGIDLVDEMLAFARAKAADRSLRNIEFRQADGETLDVPAGSFDAVFIRWGLMFMPDALACLKRARDALDRGGRIAVTCFAGAERNPWASVPLSVIRRHVDVTPPAPGTPGLFSFADPLHLRTALESAGFADVTVDEVLFLMGGEFADGAAFVEFLLDISGPISALLGGLHDDARQRVVRAIARDIDMLEPGGRIAMPGVTWLAHARKA